MKVTAFIRNKEVAKNNTTNMAHVYFRVRDGKTDIKAASELAINPNHWSAELQGYKPRVSLVTETKRMAFDKSVHELRDIIAEKYYRGANGDWLKGVIEEYHHPNINKYNGKLEQNNLVARIKEYIGTRQLAKASVDHFNYYIRKIEHFERYEQMVNKHRGYKMNIDTMNADTLTRFCMYLRNEHEIYVEHPEVFEDKASKYAPRQLSDNSLNTLFHKLNTVVNWCIKNKYTTNDPFIGFEIPKQMYGTPFYLNLEERDKVYEADLSDCPVTMQIFRDIFVFQSVIGCRVSDLMAMKKSNIINGVVEYIAQKTKSHQPRTIRVPLNDKARAILAKYKDVDGELLFPSFTLDTYNENIRKILTHVGVTRMVPTINPKTREVEILPLNKVATSHTARKTFIGNLYKKVKDSALVASLSGHTDGSRAFARYREIDTEMKRELVKMIE